MLLIKRKAGYQQDQLFRDSKLFQINQHITHHLSKSLHIWETSLKTNTGTLRPTQERIENRINIYIATRISDHLFTFHSMQDGARCKIRYDITPFSDVHMCINKYRAKKVVKKFVSTFEKREKNTLSTSSLIQPS